MRNPFDNADPLAVLGAGLRLFFAAAAFIAVAHTILSPYAYAYVEILKAPGHV